MKKRGTVYYIINVITILISVILLIISVYQNRINITVSELIICLILFILLNIIKYIRLYMIFLEERIPLGRYTKLYIKTTFVNIMMPFKLGDIFKIYCFAKEINNYKKAIIGVLLERFVDTVVLLVFLIPMELWKIGTLSLITILLIVFVAIIGVFIIAAPSTYRYLNKFLIVNRQTKLSLYILKGLEQINELYNDGLQLLKGRIYLLIIMSAISWSIDFFIIKIISTIQLNMFDISIFIEYLTSAVYQPKHIVLMNYFIIAAITFAIVNFVIYGIEYIQKVGGRK